jgi:hypothetical protein
MTEHAEIGDTVEDGFDNDIDDDLSAEERAALDEYDDSESEETEDTSEEDESATDEDIEETDDPEEDTSDDAEEPKSSGEDSTPKDDAGVDTADEDDETGTEETAKDDTVEKAQPVVTSAFDSVRAAHEVALAELEKKFDNGDVDFDEYKSSLRALERQLVKAEVAEEYARQKAEDIWQSEQQAFFKSNQYLKDNLIVMDAFAREVNKRLDDESWATKSGTEILKDAQSVIDKAFGRQPSDAKGKTEDKGKDAVKKAKKAAAKSTNLSTLRGIPAAEQNKDTKFAYLDNLTGMAYEQAVAKLSQEEMDAYAMA